MVAQVGDNAVMQTSDAAPPTLSVTLPSFGPIYRDGDWRRILDLARMADAHGVDRLLLTDHVVMGERLDAYRWGEFPFESDVPWLEPLSTIAAMAAVTEAVRFSTKILVAPLRPAALLAKTLATIDVLSAGRLEVGVGTGWQREEYDAVGADWAARGQALTDTIGACRALWGPSPTTFESPTVHLDAVWCEPKPAQPGGVPFWVAGGLHRRNLDRIVEHGAGWIPPPYSSIPVLKGGVDLLELRLRAGGRDPRTVGVQGDLDVVTGGNGRPDLAASLAAVPDWVDAGATTVNVVFSLFVGRLDRAEGFFAELSRRWPEVAVAR